MTTTPIFGQQISIFFVAAEEVSKQNKHVDVEYHVNRTQETAEAYFTLHNLEAEVSFNLRQGSWEFEFPSVREGMTPEIDPSTAARIIAAMAEFLEVLSMARVEIEVHQAWGRYRLAIEQYYGLDSSTREAT